MTIDSIILKLDREFISETHVFFKVSHKRVEVPFLDLYLWKDKKSGLDSVHTERLANSRCTGNVRFGCKRCWKSAFTENSCAFENPAAFNSNICDREHPL